LFLLAVGMPFPNHLKSKTRNLVSVDCNKCEKVEFKGIVLLCKIHSFGRDMCRAKIKIKWSKFSTSGREGIELCT
jgi:hypothetical protein